MANIYDLTDTWNNGGTTFVSIKMDVTDTASASDSKLIDLLVGGLSKFSVGKDGSISSTAEFQPSANVNILSDTGAVTFGTASDAVVVRGAADTLEMRRTINPQNFNVYNTYSDNSNYERGTVSWDSDNFIIGTESTGSGLTRNIKIIVESEKMAANTTHVSMNVPTNLKSYTVATLPTGVAGDLIFVSDETGGATLAFSDGTDWRRVQDRAVVS